MTRPRILLLGDTPNLYRSAVRKYGPSVWLDYGAFLQAAQSVGPVHCEAVVNGGVSAKFVNWLKRLGYGVTFSHAEDVDEMLIARAVALHRTADSIVIASGDGKNIELVNLFKALNKRTVVAGITGSIHHGLKAAADAVVEFPVRCPEPKEEEKRGYELLKRGPHAAITMPTSRASRNDSRASARPTTGTTVGCGLESSIQLQRVAHV